ncbi:hypothetical protein GCM10022220_61860 [Actinocatenispora rupis]
MPSGSPVPVSREMPVELHTPARPLDVASVLPQAAMRAETVRLHPRPGSPTCRESSVGGPLLWPADEPWPVCAADHTDVPGEPQPPTAYLPVAQIFTADVPSLPAPSGRDVVQVLWCPYEHDREYEVGPLPVVRWRDSTTIDRVAARLPASLAVPADHVPRPCVVHPERAVGYPGMDELVDSLPAAEQARMWERLEEWEDETGRNYQGHLADAPGIKLGGHPGWTQPPAWPDCPGCDRRMSHLITVLPVVRTDRPAQRFRTAATILALPTLRR